MIAWRIVYIHVEITAVFFYIVSALLHIVQDITISVIRMQSDRRIKAFVVDAQMIAFLFRGETTFAITHEFTQRYPLCAARHLIFQYDMHITVFDDHIRIRPTYALYHIANQTAIIAQLGNAIGSLRQVRQTHAPVVVFIQFDFFLICAGL